MDKEWRSAESNGSKSYQKGRSRQSQLGPADPSEAAENLAEYIVKALIKNQDILQIVRESSDPGHIRINVTCDPNFTGRVIGKGGKTISALRTLVRATAQPRNKWVDIEVASREVADEPEQS